MVKSIVKSFIITTLFFISTTLCADPVTNQNGFLAQKEVQKFIEAMTNKHQFNKKTLIELFNTFHSNAKILKVIAKPYEALPWYRYRERLVTPERINAGMEFWKKNEKTLNRAEKIYGVPPEIIVAILGVETFYGTKTGNFPVFEALATLGFDYPPRATFFRGELEQFLLLTREEKLDPKTILGSYAGAIGAPQFIPSSYRNFAVDFTNKGWCDLNNIQDAIGSVGNYFAKHGWKPNEPIAKKAVFKKQSKTLTTPKDLKPITSLKKYKDLGLVPVGRDTLNPKELTTVLALQNENSKEYWLGFQNFYVITRYNHSAHYAMAVFLLSEKLRDVRNSK